ncbi:MULTISPECIES: hypothetical protein [Thioalkalivibrio]|uniref:hypothetical protein n=1 Tax=Thioalkalivibrio TaxID=106633 RepID=UPI00036D7FEF|nr:MULTISPECIES: hypothetical protein [Thioalkalivibrio]OOC48787.1 hypothetical protein B0684_08010 [Thioalkalivibrio versutus]
MHFDRDFVIRNREVLEGIVARSHRVALGIFALTFGGYGAAVWLWFQDNVWAALVVATLSYLVFRQFRMLALGVARMPLRGDAEAVEALKAIDMALEQDKPHPVLAEVEAHLRALEEAPATQEEREAAGPDDSKKGAGKGD